MNANYPSTSSQNLGDATTTDVTGSFGDTLQSTAPNTYSERQGSTQGMGASLRTELSNLKSDLDALLSRATNLSEAELRQEHARLMAKFGSLRSAAKGMAVEANRQFSRGVEVSTDYVKDKPLQSVAVATGVGLVLGMLFRSR